MYEHKSQPLASTTTFYRRIAKNAFVVLIILLVMLVIGTTGYHYSTSPFTGWLDSFHNASMILSGMGPVIESKFFTAGGKIFSSVYALFSGVVFIGSVGFILGPGIHRILHKFHMEEQV